MRSILVTGGTGTLGRPTVGRLRAAGHQVRIFSRKPGPDRFVGDLTTCAGLAAAVEGIDVIVNLATSLGRRDERQARNLLDAARAAGTPHVVQMSIVGVDRIPMPYYRTKLVVERLVEKSGVPFTILRATQFHNLIDQIFRAQRFLPLLFAPAVTLQPIAVEDVAGRLVELVAAAPANGRVVDIGGPERRTVPDLALLWKLARGSHRPTVPVRVPGKTFRAYATTGPLVDGTPYGRITFAEYLA
ncbi:NAD-dependent epimerase/dehydratase family protein [Kribbella pittospori]|uniref:NAD-dependent epimerase/dehydratase family protein n=1 Tax=Kribbella pittospori TaxID=722689 RepID=A0A4R0L2U9_9ACTN|nr:NAD(P)H-binding protein [Kribbella pittospori]TCC66494.1 NAD-dependent epimerase/dehydratase family protein [Kribbella pittospori]